MITTEDQRQEILRKSLKTPQNILEAREKSKKLYALVKGDGFVDELINKIEGIEGEQKAKARKKYSRSIKDTFERLLRLTDNVYNSDGTSVNISEEQEQFKEKLIESVNNTIDGKSLSEWMESNWIDTVLMCDPNGIIFLEYAENQSPSPFYKNIKKIRNYEVRGQKLEWVLFEPKKIKTDTETIEKYRFVDDEKDYIYILRGDTFTEIPEKTFKHPFKEVPALLNSNIEDVNTGMKLSPIEPIDELMTEYARDQSIKTIYKSQNGFPIHWRLVQQCATCSGTGKDGGSTCKTCDGHGYYKSKDVTDMVTLPIPKEGDPKLAPDIAGYVNSSIETWDKYDDELNMLENVAFETLWGTKMSSEVQKTATEIYINTQPIITRLRKFSYLAESMENTLANWIARWVNPTIKEGERVYHKNLGTSFIIEPTSVLLDSYQQAKEKGDSVTILDRLYSDYLRSKYRGNEKMLTKAMNKSKVEPYVHYTVETVRSIFGQEEAQKKMLFSTWWMSLSDVETMQDVDDLNRSFEAFISSKQLNSNQTDQI